MCTYTKEGNDLIFCMIVDIDHTISSEAIAENNFLLSGIYAEVFVEVDGFFEKGNRITTVVADTGKSLSKAWGELLEK